MTDYQLICQECEKQFTATSNRKKYCSEDCKRNAAYSRKRQREYEQQIASRKWVNDQQSEQQKLINRNWHQRQFDIGFMSRDEFMFIHGTPPDEYDIYNESPEGRAVIEQVFDAMLALDRALRDGTLSERGKNIVSAKLRKVKSRLTTD